MVENNSPRPTVEYDRDIASLPYKVKVDANLCGQLLSEFGMPNEDVRQMEINIVKKLRFSTFGIHYPQDRLVVISTNWFWIKYLKHLKEIQQLVSHQKKKPSKKFQKLFYTKKMPQYLASVPSERSLPLAQRLLISAMNRRLNSGLAHELGHGLNYIINPSIYENERKRTRKWIMIGAGAGILFPIVSSFIISQRESLFINPAIELLSTIAGTFQGYLYSGVTSKSEEAANNFERQFTNHPKWKSLITITPKSQVVG